MNVNDLVYKIAERAKKLSNLTLFALRLEHAEGIYFPTQGAARRATLGMTRGELIEAVLTDEFCEEFPREIKEE